MGKQQATGIVARAIEAIRLLPNHLPVNPMNISIQTRPSIGLEIGEAETALKCLVDRGILIPTYAIVDAGLAGRREYATRVFLLGRTIFEAVRAFAIWEILCRDEVDTNYWQTAEEYKSFFEPVTDICLEFALLSIAKCFDKDSRSVSFDGVVKSAKQDEYTGCTLRGNQLDSIQNSFKKHAPIIKTVQEIRNKTIAHSDAEWKGIRDKSFYVQGLLEAMIAGYNQIANGIGIPSLTDECIKKAQEDTKGVLDLVLNKVAKSSQYHEAT